MAKKPFDLSQFAAGLGVSKLDTPAPVVEMIDLDHILDNAGNFYTVDKDKLADLANSIAMDGLQQYPVVMVHPTKEGKYLLISGHRRCAALRLLVEEGREDLRRVPCTVRAYSSPAMAELSLIVANSTARVLSPAEVSRQAARMEELLYQLKEEGYEFPGRMRDIVAKACQVSAPKLARLKVIREKLSPNFTYLFEKDKLPEQTAYALARFPAEFQSRLAKVFLAEIPPGAVVERLLAKYNEDWRWEPDLQCPDGKKCRRGDAFLRHDAENLFSMCGGQTCCLHCRWAQETYSPCDRMCSKAQAVRKEKRDADKEAVEAKRRKLSDEYQADTQVLARRLVRAIDAAGLADDVCIPWDYSSYAVSVIREYAAGKFPEGAVWHQSWLSASRIRDPAATARKLGCSTDYLLGLTDELTPAASVATETVKEVLEQADAEPKLLRWLPITDPPAQGQHIFVRTIYETFSDGLWGDDGIHPFGRGALIFFPEDIVAWMPVPGDDEIYMLLEKEDQDGY